MCTKHPVFYIFKGIDHYFHLHSFEERKTVYLLLDIKSICNNKTMYGLVNVVESYFKLILKRGAVKCKYME